jgi:hypothetical protein
MCLYIMDLTQKCNFILFNTRSDLKLSQQLKLRESFGARSHVIWLDITDISKTISVPVPIFN